MKKITDYIARIPDVLEAQFWQSPRLRTVIEAISREVQAAEDAAWDLIEMRTLDAATGAALEQYARLFGVSRGDLDDEELRRVIRARVRVNVSSGTIEDLLGVFEALTGLPARADDLHPNTILLYTTLPDALDQVALDRIWRYLNAAKKGGIRLLIVDGVEDYFGFDGDPDALGFGAGALSGVLNG